MTLFGLGGRRGAPAPLGRISQQAIRTATTVTTPAISSSVRDVLRDAMSPRIETNTTLPPVTSLIPALAPPPRKEYEQDSLRLSQFKFTNGDLVPVEKNGISVFRPEIISSFDFVSVTGKSKLGDKDPTESAEQLVKAQYQANEIRGITLIKLIQDLKRNRDYAAQLDSIKRQFGNKMANVRIALEYYSGILKKLDAVNVSLDPKRIPESLFDQEKYDSLHSFYEKRMNYSRNKFASFSDTKILNQLISDLKGILDGYSFSLLDVVDYDRENDFSPIKIDKSYTLSNNFSFSLESIRSRGQTNILASQPAIFSSFLNSLPASSDDRIKLLISILSKEMRVSKQMGIDVNARILRDKYQQNNNSSPFDNICGIVGDTIFDIPLGNNSLASLTYASTPDEDIIILPFESVYVDSQNERKTYVPGSSYFSNNILNASPTTGFDVKPYVSFASRFNSVFSDAKNIIETLLEFNVFSPTMFPETLLNYFLNSAVNVSSGLTTSTSIDRTQAIFISLIKMASSDAVLKNLVFEYFLLSGLASVSQTDQKQIFQRIAREYERMKNFSFAKFNDTDAPDLLGGISVLRPYIENLAAQIEDKVFSIIYPVSNAGNTSLFRNLTRLRPSIGLEYNTSTLSSGIFRGVGVRTTGRAAAIGLTIPPSTTTEVSFTFFPNEIKETLINAVVSNGAANTNVCKEFVDLCVKFDGLASSGGNPIYTIPDLTYRTRFNFLSTSTQMLLIFEIFSSVIQKYISASYSKGSFGLNGTITFDAGLNFAMAKIMKEMTADTVSFNLDANNAATSTTSPTLDRLRSLGTFSIRDSATTRTTIVSPSVSGLSTISNPAIRGGSFNLTYPPVFTNVDVVSVLNSPYFGFGAQTINDFAKLLTVSTKALELKKTLVTNKQKLADENKIVKNILHIFEIVNNRLGRTKEDVVRAFTPESLNSFLSATGLTVADLELVKTPSQIRTSLWLYDQYDERLGDTALVSSDIADTGLGFVVMDRIPLKTLSNMFTTFAQPEFSKSDSVASGRIKILTVGIPAGFSKNISDRVSRDAIGDVNMDSKQFDVINVCVYKRDARFDDIIFKPQKFIFDLSLFPIQNFLPASLENANLNYGQLLREIKFRDYQNISTKREITLNKIYTNNDYDFISNTQKYNMIKNHSQSQFLEYYIKFMTGLKITEEIFIPEDFQKITSQDPAVTNLIISYLRNVKRKNIPNVPLGTLLTDNQIDQETKDTIRILSYGNILFQGDFVKKRILNYKLFDRIFNIPVNLDKFEIDVEKTLETSAGRQMYSSANFQSQIKRIGEKEYFNSRDKNEASFEDVFVVLETNLRSE